MLLLLSSQTSALEYLVDDADSKVFARVGHADVTALDRMREYVVTAFDTAQPPPVTLKHLDNLLAVHSVHHTH